MTTFLLSQDQRGVLAMALQVKLRDLEARADAQQEDLPSVDFAREERASDADDFPQQAGHHEVEDGVARIAADEIAAVRRALERVHADDYGICADCGRPIPFDRLAAEPQAVRCTTCAAQYATDQARAA